MKKEVDIKTLVGITGGAFALFFTDDPGIPTLWKAIGFAVMGILFAVWGVQQVSWSKIIAIIKDEGKSPQQKMQELELMARAVVEKWDAINQAGKTALRKIKDALAPAKKEEVKPA
jgi:hypothetical protein